METIIPYLKGTNSRLLAENKDKLISKDSVKKKFKLPEHQLYTAGTKQSTSPTENKQ
jgi:hypothetical protein